MWVTAHWNNLYKNVSVGTDQVAYIANVESTQSQRAYMLGSQLQYSVLFLQTQPLLNITFLTWQVRNV